MTEAQYESLRARLLGVINQDQDSLSLYRIRTPREETVERYGLDNYISYDAPLIF